MILAVALRCMPLALFQGLAIGNVGCRMRLAVVLLIQDWVSITDRLLFQNDHG